MASGAGGGDQPIPSGGMLASEAERERCQAVLKQAFEDQRLTQDEFESRVGSAISARTLDQLAALTRDLPAPLPAATPAPPRRSRVPWIIGGIVVAAVVAALFPLLSALNSTSPQQSSAAPARATPTIGGRPRRWRRRSTRTPAWPLACGTRSTAWRASTRAARACPIDHSARHRSRDTS